MNDGKLVQSGPPAEVHDFPETRFVAEFLGEANLLSVTYYGNTSAAIQGTDIQLSPRRRILQTSRPLLFVLRPEAITLCAPDDGIMQGRLISKHYLGANFRCSAETPAGVINLLLNSSVARHVDIGTTIGLQFMTSDAVLLET
jgi:iron(III) transport system ATP-binding protein